MKRGRDAGRTPPAFGGKRRGLSPGRSLVRAAAAPEGLGACLRLVSESLCEAVDVRSGERVIDVDSGSGDASLAAARRFAEVTATGPTPELLEQALRRARAEGVGLQVRPADACRLPFSDGEFDVALCADGMASWPRPRRAAGELVRVVRRGGRIGLACWTPDGFVGQLLAVLESFAPQPAGDAPAAPWGSELRLVALFGPLAADLRTRRAQHVFRYRSAEHWIEVFSRFPGPLRTVCRSLDAAGRGALREDVAALLEAFNRGGREALVVPADYLEIVVIK